MVRTAALQSIVSVDLVGYFNNEVETIRSLIDPTQIDYVVVSSTHQHEGPDTLGIWGPMQRRRESISVISIS